MKKLFFRFLSALMILILLVPLEAEARTSVQLKLQKSSPASGLKKVARFTNQDAVFAKKFDELSIKLHSGSSYKKDSKDNPQSIAHCKSVAYQTLNALPKIHSNLLAHLTFYFTKEGRRGLGSRNTIILRCMNISDPELAAVLIHEIGHLVDTGLFEGSEASFESEFDDFGKPVFEDDPSVGFYRISFKDSTHTYENSSPLDFVSGYAMSDSFEDFAETYAYYILHGAEFRKILETSELLHEKYNYLKDSVFDGVEFGLNSALSTPFYTRYRNYDVTAVDYDYSAFLKGEF